MPAYLDGSASNNSYSQQIFNPALSDQSCKGNLTGQPNILITPTMVNKNTQNTTYNVQSQPQQLQAALSQAQMPHQQQVPMTTIMIPASAAAQIQSASAQIQQAAMQANLNNPLQPQILVFMIPYMIPNQPPTIPPTPDQSSLNSTLIRQSHLTASMIRSSQHQLQAHQHHQLQQQSILSQQPHPHQPLLTQQQQPIIARQQPIITQQQPHQQHQTFLAQQQQIQSLQSQAQAQQQPQSINPQSQQPFAGPSQNRTASSTANYKQESEKFYIKANFSYHTTRNKGELSFQKGDILLVIDTLQNSEYVSNAPHYWLATRLTQTGKDSEKGLIPDKSKAEEIALEQRTLDLTESGSMIDGGSGQGGVLSGGVGRVSFLKRRSAQRSKSLCRDNWDNVVFDIGSFKLPSYERVIFKHPGFCRPVVIFGPLADVAREKLLKDYPEKYSYPIGFNNQPHGHPKVIRLKGILEVIDQEKHALLDITPSAVEKLNYVNLAPIVIFMKTDSKSIIKEFRTRAAKSLVSDPKDEETLRRDGKSSRKLLEQSIKLEKTWYHVFTATLNLSTMGSEMWYRKLRETIENQQSANVWMSERKSDKKIASLTGNSNINTTTSMNNNNMNSNTNNSNNLVGNSNNNTSNNDVIFNMPAQSTSSHVDSTTFINDRFNESLNITSKSTIDLLPDGTYGYNGGEHCGNAYAHTMAQRLARASSEPKLNGNVQDTHDQNDYDDDDDDDDDEIIKKPFPVEYENSSSVSSSNGTTSFGAGNVAGVSSAAQMTYQHYATQMPKSESQMLNSNSSMNHTMNNTSNSNANNNNNTNNNSLSRTAQESIYSRNPIVNNNSNSAYTNGNCSSLSNYHPLPPIGAENGYQLQHNPHQSMNSINSNNNNVIDLSRNHETRGSAFQVYSDMNQNNYHYYNPNKIL